MGKKKLKKLDDDVEAFIEKFRSLSQKEKLAVIDRLVTGTPIVNVSARHKPGIVLLDRFILERFDLSLAQYLRLALSALAAAYLESEEAGVNRLLSYLEVRVRKNAEELLKLGESQEDVNEIMRRSSKRGTPKG
jgi:hypothetical protein